MKDYRQYAYPALACLVFVAGVLMRPAFPVDETRYLTAAWEMYFTGDLFHLTVNFESYSHKPPFLFWLINIMWRIFGVGRFAATVPVIVASMVVVVLTGKLARRVFPDDEGISARARMLLIGGVPFLIYGSLIMFDMMITVWVLAALLCLISFAEKRDWKSLAGYGLCLGFGVLTKGPVVCVYALLPALLAPFWADGANPERPTKSWAWYGAVLIAVLIALVPVMAWLGPLTMGADSNFLYWLLWKQTAGRVAGGFSDIHPRPFYFYLLILPAFFLPWMLFPSFWRGIQKRWPELRAAQGGRFLALWLLPAFIAFSLITGKQPHYLVPLLPGFIIICAFLMRDISDRALKISVLAAFTIFVVGHVVAMKKFFPAYDLRQEGAHVQKLMAAKPAAPWAFVRNYNGEIGFMGRVTKPFTVLNEKQLPAWFKAHPDGYAVIRYHYPDSVKNYAPDFINPYRGNHFIGVFHSAGKISEQPYKGKMSDGDDD